MDVERRGAGPTFVSLFSGSGGLDLGFVGAGFEPLWANDIDPIVVETHNKLIGSHVAVTGDIRDQKLPLRGSAEVVVGGPPCQGFSVAGRMDPDDPRSHHVWDFMAAVDHIQPRAFVMENVRALATSRRWAPLRHRLVDRSLEMGYATQLLLLNASHFDVPQARERMFLIGTRDTPAVVPLPTSASNPPTVRSALASLPPLGELGNDSACSAKVVPAKNPVLRRSPYAGMLFNGHGRPLDLDRPAVTLPATMSGNRTPIIDQEQLAVGADSWVEEYHAHLWAGGAPKPVAPGRMRRITVEEAAAIQTFPAGVYWAGGRSAQYRQIGNAVPPILALHVAVAVDRALVGEQTSPPAGWMEQHQLLHWPAV